MLYPLQHTILPTPPPTPPPHTKPLVASEYQAVPLTLDRGRTQMSRSSYNTGPSRRRRSRSRSPYKRKINFCKRSASPETKRSSFRNLAAGSSRRDKLPACPVCLGRHRHRVASCQATKTWNGRDTICTRTDTGRILNKRGAVICADWQRPNRCTDSTGKHLHECSGCGSADHGADFCSFAEP